MSNRNFLYINSDYEIQEEVASVTSSAGAGDSGKLVTLDTDGKFNLSVIPDSIINNRDFKDSVKVASTADANWTGTAEADYDTGSDELTITSLATGSSRGALDGVTTLADGDFFLLKDAATISALTTDAGAEATPGKYNGIWEIIGGSTTSIVATRRADADADAEVTAGMTVPIEEGTNGADKLAILTTNDPITVNTTALTFAIQNTMNAGAGPGVLFSSGKFQADLDTATPIEFTGSGDAQQIAVAVADTSDTDDLDGTNGAHVISAEDLYSNGANQGANILGGDPSAISQSSATTVQGILNDLSTAIADDDNWVEYTADEALSAADLLYISGNNLVSKIPLTGAASANRAIGVALAATSDTDPVRVLANDTVVEGVVTGLTPTAGDKVYWSGSALTLTAPTGT